ncbi:MAG: hypothetical protein C5B56_00510 [Proteobacteria bacterium]|nr:MAG: hypothetical protein C5B56_00510 [Pseudomonadota bacterium]
MSHLQTLFDGAGEQIPLMFAEDGCLCAPMWHGITEDGEPVFTITPWENQEEKLKQIESVRERFKRQKVVAYISVSEAWTLSTATEEEARAWAGRVSEHPDGREVIVIQGEDISGRQMMGVFHILRPEHGPATLSPFHLQEDCEAVPMKDNMVGWLS